MILLRAKDIEFDVTYINLLDKPEWFLDISPHGKVPVLKVGEDILFGELEARIRDVRVAPDGAVWLLTDEAEGRIVRVVR